MPNHRLLRTRVWLPSLLAIGFVALVIVRVLAASSEQEPEPTIDQIRAEHGVPVRVVEATAGPLEVWRSFSGTVSGVREGVVRARSDAQIVEVPVALGSRVRRGDLLVRLSGEAEEARLRQATVNERQARRRVQRLRGLFEAGALSEQDWEDASSALELAEAERAAARDALELISPLDGAVTELQAREGGIPSSGDPLVRVADLSRLVVRLQVSAGEAAELSAGDPARVPGGTANGVVRRISLQADPLTRLVDVELEFPGTRELIAGTLATVEVRTVELEDVVQVPEGAIVSGIGTGGATTAWVVDEGGRATVRDVQVGVAGDEGVEIAAGLAAGDRVVVEGASLLEEGARVQILNGAEGEER